MVSIQSDGNLGQVLFASSQYKVIGVDPSEYPSIPDVESAATMTIDSHELREMIRKTGFAASSEMVRYALTGQLLHVIPEKGGGMDVRMVTSDGKRLAYIRRKHGAKDGTAPQKEIKVLLPPKALNLIDRMFTEENEKVALYIDETQVKVITKRGMVFCRLIEGNFPDYETVIPKECELKVSLNPQHFVAAVRKAALMTNEKTRAVKLAFSSGRLVVSTRSQDVGEATSEMAVDYKGEEIQIVFNPDYLIDFARATDVESVDLHLKDKSSAGVFKAGKDYIYVVMPLAVAI
ncbi:MAG: DNA polymerase III subunit beta [Planctomycetes bacterium RBG_16_59_8]|nr:MAG: DNA polymerase III subunit beta [Planctomycetes bacterium RBG_16_59_8]